jgi:dihydroflavonol-4-reductase
MQPPEKIFITGGTGFIGARLVRRLVRDAHPLVCLVRRPASAGLDLPQVTLVPGDVTDADSVRAGMQGCTRVIHLAGLYSMWRRDPGEFARVNVEGTRNVLQAALDAGVERVVNISTVAVYGVPHDRPFQESSAPGKTMLSEYARTKSLADGLAWSFYREHGLPVTSLYPGIVLGAGDHKASGSYIQDYVFRRIPSTIFHDSWATYVSVDDVAEAIARATWDPRALGQRYLVGQAQRNGREYAHLIHQVSGVPAPLFELPDWMVTSAAYLLTALAQLTGISPLWGLSVDAAHTLHAGFRFDGTKIQRELGLEYTPIEAALREAIESYRAERNKPEPIFQGEQEIPLFRG